MEEILQKIEEIKSVFINTQLFCGNNNCMNSLQEYLEQIPVTFRSIGYECASMTIALKGFDQNSVSPAWRAYACGPARLHQAQVYVGLGWAIAKLTLPFLEVVKDLDPFLHSRVADGCGYYDASFRQRQTVKEQQLPGYLPAAALPMYDQGLGRSFWYSCRADIEIIKSKIADFAADRQASLWRGAGIAIAYVGGCDEKYLKIIFDAAGKHAVQLACGAALAAKSRREANTLTSDTDLCSRLWFDLAGSTVEMFTVPPGKILNRDVYLSWLNQIEAGVANRFTIENE